MSEHNRVVFDAVEALEELAAKGNPAAIAQHLQSQGITGKMYEIYGCPVANYLKAETGAYAIGVHFYLSVLDADGLQLTTEETLTPVPVLDFIHAFDRGEYPGLIAK